MVQISPLFAAAFLAHLALGAPAPPTKSAGEIFTEVYGPLDTWTPVRLIDVHPNATVDGKPVDDSVIYSYEPPANITIEQRDEVSKRLAARELSIGRRFVIQDPLLRCYTSGNWVPQYQLYSAKDVFCNEASSKGLRVDDNNKNVHWQNKKLWGSGNEWHSFTNQEGRVNTVFYKISMVTGEFDWNTCFDGFWSLINRCPGRNPDSAGGSLTFSGKSLINVQIDPWE